MGSGEVDAASTAAEAARSMPRSSARRPSRLRRKLTLALFALVAASLFVEGALQCVSYGLWLSQRKPVARSEGRAVLCVGDSWTHGMGSVDTSTGSYPARVGRILAAAGVGQWQVVNAGQSGQNSRDVLERLPSQIAAHAPRFVVVLVGQNDFWSKPDPLPADERSAVDHTAYRFRWRLPRLVMLALGSLRGVGEAPRAVRDPAQWQSKGVAETQDPYPNDHVVRWTPELGEHKAAGWKAMGAGDHAAALLAFEAALRVQPEDAQSHAMLAEIHRRTGRDADALVEVEWLRAEFGRRPGHRLGLCFADALAAVGRSAECATVAASLLERFPQSGKLWRHLAIACLQTGDVDGAERAIDRAVATGPDRWNQFWRYKVHFLGRKNVVEAAHSLFELYVIENDADFLAECLAAMLESTSSEQLLAALDGFRRADDVKARIRVVIDDLHRAKQAGSAAAVLRGHLERIAVTVRNAGAEPVFLDYPFWNESGVVLRDVADELGVAFVDMRRLFTLRRGDVPESALCAADGHCNDAGYAIVAEIVAETLVPRLRALGR
jgi:lysophospholipase L1-like esterase